MGLKDLFNECECNRDEKSNDYLSVYFTACTGGCCVLILCRIMCSHRSRAAHLIHASPKINHSQTEQIESYEPFVECHVNH